MAERRSSCFVIMPFASALNYFFLYLRRHIEETHGIDCERADSRFATGPFLDKILAQIRGADVVIVDCTGNNSNVLYELGIAHALNKKVILITQDRSDQFPSDVKHFEFIQYDLAEHQDFLAKLDAALHEVLVEQYNRLYEEARSLIRTFKEATTTAVDEASKDLFVQRAKEAEAAGPIPSAENPFGRAVFLLLAIIANSEDETAVSEITNWATATAARRPPGRRS